MRPLRIYCPRGIAEESRAWRDLSDATRTCANLAVYEGSLPWVRTQRGPTNDAALPDHPIWVTIERSRPVILVTWGPLILAWRGSMTLTSLPVVRGVNLVG